MEDTAAVRRLSKDEHLGQEFATIWPQYNLDEKTRALLGYAKMRYQEKRLLPKRLPVYKQCLTKVKSRVHI
jgi:hypothetical protein